MALCLICVMIHSPLRRLVHHSAKRHNAPSRCPQSQYTIGEYCLIVLFTHIVMVLQQINIHSYNSRNILNYQCKKHINTLYSYSTHISLPPFLRQLRTVTLLSNNSQNTSHLCMYNEYYFITSHYTNIFLY